MLGYNLKKKEKENVKIDISATIQIIIVIIIIININTDKCRWMNACIFYAIYVDTICIFVIV